MNNRQPNNRQPNNRQPNNRRPNNRQPNPDHDDPTQVRRIIQRANGNRELDDDGGSLHVLPNGTRLGEFEVVGLISEGGFGIVYKAYDPSSPDRHVAIKEYMPSGMATRSRTLHLSVRSRDHAEIFEAGLRSFIKEARLLSQFDSPSLVKVNRFWEANNTAYMVMPFYEGITLKEAIRQRQIIPTEAWTKSFLAALCDALEMMHRARCYHRDIAPDNILVLDNGNPLLLDFGAARRSINDRTHGPTALLKPGFAPIEQYADISDLKQGPWTDVYGLAAVVYYLMTGKTPVPAIARFVKDEMLPAREVGRGRYSDGFLAVIDHALAVRPDQRLHNIAAFRSELALNGDLPPTMPTVSSAIGTSDATRPSPDATESPIAPHATRQAAHVARAAQAAHPILRRIEPVFGDSDPLPPRREQADAPYPAPDAASHWKNSAVGLLLVTGLVCGLYWYQHADETAAPRLATAEVPFHPIRPPAGGAVPASQAASPDPAVDPGTPVPTPSEPVADLARQSPPPAAPAAPPPSETAMWKDTNRLRTAGAYQAYLEQYPIGRHARQASDRLAHLQRERTPPPVSAAAAQASPARSTPMAAAAGSTAPAPTGNDSVTASFAPSPMVRDESSAWIVANQANTASAYQVFLATYPTGPNARTARNRLDVMKQTAPGDPASPEIAATPPAVNSVGHTAATTSAPSSAALAATANSASPSPGTAGNASKPSPSVAGNRPIEAPASMPPDRAKDVTKDMPREISTSSAGAGRPSTPGSTAAPGGTTIRVAGQIFTGNFAADPATGIVSGAGRVAWSNGDRFDGMIVNGAKQGQGEFTWANGQRYKGQWAKDLPNGSGSLHFANGNDYVGQIRDGVPEGKGAVKYADGGRYRGSFSNGLPNGTGVSEFKNGDTYDGQWVRGKSNGRGKYTWASGDYWEGEFRDDQRTANGKTVFADKPAAPGAPDTSSAAAEQNGIRTK